MNESRVVKKSIKLHTGVSQVWEALTNPELTKKYFFNCEAISDWCVGSSIVFKMLSEGKEVVAVKGLILAIQENALLKYSCYDPRFEEDPSRHTTVTVVLSSETDGTTLTVTQGEFGDEEAFNHTGAGWEMVLSGLKELLESKE